jgi:hypothetical protein
MGCLPQVRPRLDPLPGFAPRTLQAGAASRAVSKRTKLQCGGPAMQGKTKCKFHGGLSTGPRTDEGKLRHAQAKTKHGKDTRADRRVHRLAMKRLRLYAQILGVPFRSDAGDKRL